MNKIKNKLNIHIILTTFLLLFFCVFQLNDGKLLRQISASADGKSEIVEELSTGTTLFEKNSNKQLPMASTTKIMTALIIIEDCDLDEEIVVPDEAVGIEGSSIYLKKDEKISIKDLVYGLMLRSGNDCANTLAIHHSGNIKNFVIKMNEKAKEIGANDTNFTNPSGLPDENHYTTAKDLCLIARTAMQNETFRKVVATKNYNGKYRSFVNKNKLLNSVDGADGIKTGYTITAGRCLVSSATRNGMTVICVVLNCPDMYERSKEMINNSFNQFEFRNISNESLFMCNRVLCKIKENKVYC
jgi:D-alanyl-D-alanine carboxypeptidase (penicillin-binding protein 5/6)